MKFSQLLAQFEPVAAHSLEANSIDPDLNHVAPIDSAPPGSISYIEGSNSKFAAQLQTTQASALILPKDASLQAAADDRGIAWISSSQPRLLFAQAIAAFYQPFRPPAEIHPSAVIDPSVQLGSEVAIGANVVIQAGVKIGDGVCIHPNVVIYPDAEIGDRTVLHANCVIHERSQLGADCVIHSGVAIGSEGFGFVPTAAGWYKMEQSGRTILEDGVEVGCNSAIDRPAVGETRIGRNTKIDNLVQIGHGCRIGQACAIAGQTGLAGGVTLGDRVILAGQVGIANQATVGSNTTVGAKSGIITDMAGNQTIVGNPALPHRTFLKVTALHTRLPELYQTIKQLQKKLKDQG